MKLSLAVSISHHVSGETASIRRIPMSVFTARIYAYYNRVQDTAMQIQITDAGVALLQTNQAPVALTLAKFGSGVNYTPQPSDTNIHGTAVFSTAPTAPVVVSANIYRYSVIVDLSAPTFDFGEVGLFTEDGTLFALCVSTTLIHKLQMTAPNFGNTVRLDAYLSIVGQNYDMWMDTAESNNQFRMAVLGSVDQLPQPQNATPNAYVIQGLSSYQSSFLTYTDRAGLWSFDAYSYATQVSGTVEAADSRSVTIPLAQFAEAMDPTYFGEVILEFTSGALYGICRYVKTAVISGNNVTLGFNTPVLITPQVGDTFVTFKRVSVSNESTIPPATTLTLGGIIVGPSLTVQLNGTLDVDDTKIPYPVKTVAGRTGDVVLAYSDVSGLATVAHTGSYNDLTNKPTAYALPVATTTVLGGVKAPGTGNLTISAAGVIDLGFTPVSSVNGNSGAVVINQANPSGFAVVAFTGSYNDLTNKPTAYSLPVATATVLGGVKQGAGVTIAGDGTISVNAAGGVSSVSGQTGAVVVQATNNNIATGATLIADSGATTGNVKLKTIVAGTNISTSLDGNSNLVINSTYALPPASASVLGGVKQGTGITIAGDGTISVSAAGGVSSVSGQTGAVVVQASDNNAATGTSLISNSGATTANIKLKTLVAGTSISLTTDANGNVVVNNTAGAYTLPVATSSVLGGVKQGANVAIAGDGTISVAAPYTLPVASSSVLGGVKQGAGVTIAGDGTLSVTASGVTTFNTRSGAVVLNGTDITGAGGALATDVAAAKYYDVPGGAPGTMTASQIIGKHTFVRAVTFPANFAGSQSHATAGATGSVTVTLTNQAGTVLGTMVIAASGTTATFTSTGGTQVVMAAGQTIIATAPATPDATLANFTFTLLGLAT